VPARSKKPGIPNPLSRGEQTFERAKAAASAETANTTKLRDAKTARLTAQRVARDQNDHPALKSKAADPTKRVKKR
jgi:hypothetical protein